MPPIYQYKVMECYWPVLFMNISAAIANVWARGTGLGASGEDFRSEIRLFPLAPRLAPPPIPPP